MTATEFLSPDSDWKSYRIDMAPFYSPFGRLATVSMDANDIMKSYSFCALFSLRNMFMLFKVS